MKFLKNIFKKEKKYKLILTEDEMFFAMIPAIYMWWEEIDKELKENKNNIDDNSKEIYEKNISNCLKIIIKMKKANGTEKYWKKWYRKNRKMLKKWGLK